jgi:cell division protein FtsB
MKRVWSFLLGVYVAGMAYGGLTLIWGPKGYLQYQHLLAYKVKLEANVNQLEDYHSDLALHAKSLASDRKAVMLAARELGYYQADEGRIVLENGYKPTSSGSFAVGAFIKPYESEKSPIFVLKLVAIFMGAIATLLTWNLFTSEGKKR